MGRDSPRDYISDGAVAVASTHRRGGDPMKNDLRTIHAQARVEHAALAAVTADRYADDNDAHADAHADYAGDVLALAARDLTRAVNALDAADRPVGWDTGAEVA